MTPSYALPSNSPLAVLSNVLASTLTSALPSHLTSTRPSLSVFYIRGLLVANGY